MTEQARNQSISDVADELRAVAVSWQRSADNLLNYEWAARDAPMYQEVADDLKALADKWRSRVGAQSETR